MKAYQTDFGTGSVSRSIMEMALPMMFAQVLNLLYNIVDRMYIGRIEGVGTLALTGVGLCFPIITMISAFTQLFGNGGAPLFAMERGRKNEKEAEYLMGNTFTMLLLSGVILMVIGLVFYKPILYLFGASDNTFPFAESYIRIYLLGTLFVMVSVGMNPFINSQGFGRMGMLTVLIGAVMNIILDPLFIFGFHMEVRGAALATILSQFCSALWVFLFLTGKRAAVKLTMRSLKVEGKRILAIMSLGMSGFFMAFTNSLVQIVCNATLQTYGGDIYVGVMTVLNSIREIFNTPVHGISNGASPVLSFNYGARSADRVRAAIRFVTMITVTVTLAAWGIVRVFGQYFIQIFNSDPELISKGVPSLNIYFFGFCFMAFQFTGQCVFVALGKAKRATFFSLFRKVVIVVPLTLWLPNFHGLGVDGVFWAEPISNLVGGMACFLTMLATILPELKRMEDCKTGENMVK